MSKPSTPLNTIDYHLKYKKTCYGKKNKRNGKNRRGRRNSIKNVNKTLIFGGANPDGAMSKWTTIKKAKKHECSCMDNATN